MKFGTDPSALHNKYKVKIMLKLTNNELGTF